MHFARTLFRSNSSFSWWAAELSDAIVYSPIVPIKPVDKRNMHVVAECEFVNGNHPHFMGNASEGVFHDIVLGNTQ